MRSYLITVNLGGNMHPKVRNSVLNATHRWGLDYLEVTTPLDSDLTPWYQKWCVYRLLQSPCRFVILDYDMMVRFDCPSYLSMVPEGMFGITNANQSHTPAKWQQQRDWCRDHWREKGLDVNEWVPNGAPYVGELPLHQSLFDACVHLAKQHGAEQAVMGEQCIMSSVLTSLEVPTALIETRYNWVQLSNGDGRLMSRPVFHFASQPKEGRINSWRWR